MLQIVTSPNSVLSQKAKPIEKIDSFVQKLIEDMKQTLSATSDPEGVGLAAPQIGKLLQIFIIKPNKKADVETFINPQIELLDLSEQNKRVEQKNKSNNKEHQKLEGCLSLPSIWGTVSRSPKVKITYRDATGKKRTRIVGDFPAVIIQHEYDHLQGILFPKRVLEQKGTLYKSHKNEKGQDEFEELEIS